VTELARPLWRFDELVAAASGVAEGAARAVTGVSIDTRTLQPGDLFVALKDQRDGHEFVALAFAKGAAAALVAQSFAGAVPAGAALIRVDDPLTALARIGVVARARTAARIVAVTGSVGKTGTKEALRSCLSAQAPTHASEKSYNNHWGVPLTLARMPADVRFGVFEIGMNHAGEITPLSRMVRPEAAIVTTVGPVHIEFFGSEEAIADAKAEIFEGLQPGGTAILNRDNRHFDRLAAAAKRCSAGRILAFGRHDDAAARVLDAEADAAGTNVTAEIDGTALRYRVGAPGDHYVVNTLAVLAAVKVLGGDLAIAAAALAEVAAPVGRGERTRYDLPGGPVLLIDESYNANPASMRAALAAMATTPRAQFPRRIAVLGDMRELGVQADELHRELAGPVVAAGIDRVLAAGPHMARLAAALPAAVPALHADAAAGLAEALLAEVRPGDVVMIKGSLGSRMGPLVDALKSRLALQAEATRTAAGRT
jgi:UDP-N-acetylmuramoyl-tripeptide--D-alanyl-D-alanine ligase